MAVYRRCRLLVKGIRSGQGPVWESLAGVESRVKRQGARGWQQTAQGWAECFARSADNMRGRTV